MSILLPALVAMAALCVWLGVRIINRRERWAICTAIAVIMAPVLFVVSFGPACWISSRANVGTSLVSVVYGPIVKEVPIPSAIADLTDEFSRLGANSGWRWGCVIGSDDWKWFDAGQ